jgi:hypothetical protein
LRTAARAEVIRRRSIKAMRRPNGVVEGVKPMEAVLDIVVPFSEAQRIAASLSGNNLRIPDASYNAFVCIAAYYLLQCNIRP